MEKIKATTDTIDTSTDLTVASAFLGRCGKKWQPLVFKWEHFFIKQLIWQNSTKPPRVSELHFLIASWFSFGTVFLCYEISWSSCFKVGGRKHSSNIQDQVQSYLSPLNRLKSSKTKTFLVPFHVQVVPWACHLSVTRVQMFHFRERNYSWWKDSQWLRSKNDVWDSIKIWKLFFVDKDYPPGN